MVVWKGVWHRGEYPVTYRFSIKNGKYVVESRMHSSIWHLEPSDPLKMSTWYGMNAHYDKLELIV